MITSDEYDRRTLLRLEKEVLGQFVTDHPLLGVKERLAALADMEIADTEGLHGPAGQREVGIVVARRRQRHDGGRQHTLWHIVDALE